MFHVFVQRPLEPLEEAALDLAERTRTWIGGFAPTDVPSVQKSEVSIGPPSLDVPVDEARALWEELLAASGP